MINFLEVVIYVTFFKGMKRDNQNKFKRIFAKNVIFYETIIFQVILSKCYPQIRQKKFKFGLLNDLLALLFKRE